VFYFHESRSRDGPSKFLADFRGTVKVDAYGVDQGVYLGSGGRILASCCLAHARRKFEEAKSSHPGCRPRRWRSFINCTIWKTVRGTSCRRNVALCGSRKPCLF